VRAWAGSVEPEKFGEAAAVADADALAADALGAGTAELAATDALGLALLAGAAGALVLPLLAGEPELAGAADAAPAD